MTRAYGRIPDQFDPLDLKLSLPRHLLTPALPSRFSLRDEMPPVYDQGELGSCTGNATAAVFQHALRKQGLTDFEPSRLALYYLARKLEGTTRRDDGAQLRDVFKVLGKNGAGSEVLWPYDVARFAKAPPAVYTRAAAKHLAAKYLSIDQTASAIKAALFARYPVAFGFTAYASLESDEVARTGLLPMPGHKEAVVGGHAVVKIGWDDDKAWPGGIGMWEVRNSWGGAWADAGHFWMPYPYSLNPQLASDFWTVEAISS